MRVLIVPDKFKGTLSSDEVANAMERGVEETLPEATCRKVLVSDGGQGFVRALASKGEGRIEDLRASGGRIAQVARLGDGTYVLESAEQAGFKGHKDALGASTRRVGEAIAAVRLREDVRSIYVGVGGTLATDGGTGAATACGWRFLDRRGEDLAPGGGSLAALSRIVPPSTEVPVVPIVGGCDVQVPLTGERGSARLFSPQKGARPDEVTRLEEGLLRLQERVSDDLGVDLSAVPFAGAGGGLGGGLVAFFGARLRSGFELVAEALDLPGLIAGSDIVLTGEGSLDAQSLEGKVPVAVGRMAAARGRPCIAVAGRVELTGASLRDAGITLAEPLVRPGASDPAAAVTAATARALLKGSLG
jgi:glycerate kinase